MCTTKINVISLVNPKEACSNRFNKGFFRYKKASPLPEKLPIYGFHFNFGKNGLFVKQSRASGFVHELVLTGLNSQGTLFTIVSAYFTIASLFVAHSTIKKSYSRNWLNTMTGMFALFQNVNYHLFSLH
jgi:hypothetical protein